MTSNMPENPVGNQVIRVSIALGVLVTLAVPLRLLARWKSKAKFALDDALIIISVIPQYVMIAIGVLGSSCDHCLITSKLTVLQGSATQDWVYLLRSFPPSN